MSGFASAASSMPLPAVPLAPKMTIRSCPAGASEIGASDSAPQTRLSPYYIRRAHEQTHTPNIVSAVLADYRGYDTMLETGVVFTAAMASLLILGLGARREPVKTGEAPR